jgi:hypothetical protein
MHNIFRISTENYLCRYSNIFVTAPSPENLKTLFEFVCKGLSALDYKVQALSLIDIYNHYCLNKIQLELVYFQLGFCETITINWELYWEACLINLSKFGSLVN